MKFQNAILALIIVPFFLMAGSTQGQDIDALLKAVEKIERNLKSLVEHEATTRSKQYSELKSAIAKNKNSNKGSRASGISEQQLAEVINELAVLSLQVAELKTYFEDNSRQFVSLDDFSPQQADQRVEELNAKLESLSHDVHGMISDQHVPAETHKKADEHSKTAVHGKLFGHGLVNLSDNGGSNSEFAMSRAYLTVKSELSDYASIKVTTDLRTIDEKYNIILKYAYFDWKPSFSKGFVGLRFGLQPTEYIDYMNKLWGRRYAAPTVGDLHHFLTTSDLGVSTRVGFGPNSDYGFVKMSLLNGTSYSHVEEANSRKDFNIVTIVKPFKSVPTFKNSALLMQFYTGTQNEHLDDLVTIDSSVSPSITTITPVSASDWKRQMFSFGGAMVWDHTVDFGFDLNFVTLGKGALKSSVKKQGISFFGAFYFHEFAHSAFLKHLGLIGRLDMYDPDTGTGNNNETLTVIGIESKPIYNFKVALNYRTTSFQDNTQDSHNSLFVNTLFKF